MYYINPNIKSLVRVSPIEGRDEYLRLDMNENPEGLPQKIVDKVLNEITPDFLAMYPETGKLIKKISQQLDIEEENICITNGSDMAIRYIFEVFAKPGCNVVSVSPSFEMYGVYCNMYNLNNKKVEYDSNFNICIEDIVKEIDNNTNIVVLLNPNNPIGNVYSRKQIEMIIQKANSVGAIVIIDEAYHYFNSGTYLDYINKFNNVIVLRTFSKFFSIAGCRIGFAISTQKIINYIKKVKNTFDTNSIAIKFAENIIDDKDLIDKLIYIEKEGREFILSKLIEYGYNYHSDNGNYIFIETKKDPSEIYNRLKDRKILIKIYKYDILRKYIRITTGSKQVMQRFMNEFLDIEREVI